MNAKRDKPKICENEIILIKLRIVRATSPKNSLGTTTNNKRD